MARSRKAGRQQNWVKIMNEIKQIKDRGEGLILIGDMNRAIGSDKLGVKGNNSEVSFGGSMIRDLLEQEEEEKQEQDEEQRKQYYLLNSWEHMEGGPWTWLSRVDSSIKSCLDLVILSAT